MRYVRLGLSKGTRSPYLWAVALCCGTLTPFLHESLAAAEEFAVDRFAGCQAEAAIDTELLIGGWTHSREEDKDFEGKVFRPSNSRKFPMSRFRNRYVFNADGSGKYMYLHPSDQHHMKGCQWELTEDEPPAIRITAGKEGKKPIARLKILELTKDILRVK